MKEIYLGTATSWNEMCSIMRDAVMKHYLSDDIGIAFCRTDGGETSSVEIYLREYDCGFKEFYFIP